MQDDLCALASFISTEALLSIVNIYLNRKHQDNVEAGVVVIQAFIARRKPNYVSKYLIAPNTESRPQGFEAQHPDSKEVDDESVENLSSAGSGSGSNYETTMQVRLQMRNLFVH